MTWEELKKELVSDPRKRKYIEMRSKFDVYFWKVKIAIAYYVNRFFG